MLGVVILGVLAIAVVGGFLHYVMKGLGKPAERWRRLPTLAQYLEINPECRTKRGIRCWSCDSGSIKNWGLYSPSDQRRIFICNHCGTDLYTN